MKKSIQLLMLAWSPVLFYNCGGNSDTEQTKNDSVPEIPIITTFEIEPFADVQVLSYEIHGFDSLTVKQKTFVYYLYEAALSGRDIIWDQKYKYNLEIRNALENIVRNYQGDTNNEDWKKFMVYTKRVWFSNGIHHHYSNDKFIPDFSKEYFQGLLSETGTELDSVILNVMFDPTVDMKLVNQGDGIDLLQTSAMNFYGDNVTQKEAEAFYAEMLVEGDTTPIEYGLNSTLMKDENGKLYEDVWKVGGRYSEAITEIVYWLEKAQSVAENDKQAHALGLLIEYYKTGDLEKWSEYNVAWASDTEGDIDYIQGFVEVYGDPLHMRGTYESIVQIKDFEASARMKTLEENVQWFEDNSSIKDEHKKPDVVGVTYKVVNVANEAGDASPSTPIGVNLPNANWIREHHGSKSVSLGNLVEAYENAGGDGLLEEFAHDQEEIDLAKKHGSLSSKLHTAMHEVIGHASGKINKGVGTPRETLKSYASCLEEARADLVGLYFIMDPKVVELGLMESLDVGKAGYDYYIRNGLMVQLRRIEPGRDVEEAHMQNRQLVSQWVFEKGAKDNVIERVERDGKIYFNITDYEKLRVLFGELLRELQRITSEGDYKAGMNLVEKYGVKVDQEIHQQVLERCEPLNIAPYNGFVNPILIPVMDKDGNITDVKVSQPESFQAQMLSYSEKYGFLARTK